MKSKPVGRADPLRKRIDRHRDNEGAGGEEVVLKVTILK